MVGKSDDAVFVSFRIDYQVLKKKYIPTNIYAVPDLNLPFLGIHVTPMLDCTTLLGPTAVPAFNTDRYK